MSEPQPPRPIPARAELGKGGAADGHGLGIAHEVEGAVEGVDADVEQGAAAGQIAVGEPAAVTGDAAAALPGGAHGIDLAKEAGVGLLLGGLHGRREAIMRPGGQDAVVGGGDVEHLLGIGVGEGEWLLAQHVGAGFERGDGHGLVEDVGRGHHRDVGANLGQHRIVVAVRARDLEIVGQYPGAGLVDVADGDDFAVGQALEARDVAVLGDAAGADNGDAVGIRSRHKLGAFAWNGWKTGYR